MIRWEALHEDAAAVTAAGRSVGDDEALGLAMEAARAVGVVRISDLTHLDDVGVPVTMAVRPSSRSGSTTMGKGLDRTAALISAAMEAVERACAEVDDDEAVSIDAASLGADAIRPEALPQPSEPAAAAPIPWMEGIDIVAGAPCHVPLEAVTLNWPEPPAPWSGHVLGISTGLSAGWTRPEAALQGLCELIERDALTLWDLQSNERRCATRIDVRTITDQASRRLIGAMQRAGLVVGVWDITSAVGIPAFQAGVLPRTTMVGGPLELPAGGAGCHPVWEVALRRALTEAAQSRLALRHGLDDEASPSRYRVDRGVVEGPARMLADTTRRPIGRPPSGPPRTSGTYLADTVAALVRAGTDRVVVVDLTREGLPPVVRVVVPGLEAFSQHPGWTPGPRARAVLASAESVGP